MQLKYYISILAMVCCQQTNASNYKSIQVINSRDSIYLNSLKYRNDSLFNVFKGEINLTSSVNLFYIGSLKSQSFSGVFKTQNYCSLRVAIKISTSSMISRSIKIGVIKIFLKLNLAKLYTKILQAHSLRCCGTAFIIH